MKINDSGYYESKTATKSDAQVDLTQNMETGSHTSNGNGKLLTLATGILNILIE